MAKKGDIKNKEKFEEVKKDVLQPDAAPDAAPEIQLNDAPRKTRRRRTRAELEALKKRPIASEANPLFIPVVKIPFDIWAKGTIPEVALTDDEARVFALPITQLVEYYLPQMPDIWAVWANLAVQMFGIMSVRLSLLAQIRKARQPKPDNTPGDNAPNIGAKPPTFYTPKVI